MRRPGQNRKCVLRRFAEEQGLRIWARGKRAFSLGNSGGFETFSPRSVDRGRPTGMWAWREEAETSGEWLFDRASAGETRQNACEKKKVLHFS